MRPLCLMLLVSGVLLAGCAPEPLPLPTATAAPTPTSTSEPSGPAPTPTATPLPEVVVIPPRPTLSIPTPAPIIIQTLPTPQVVILPTPEGRTIVIPTITIPTITIIDPAWVPTPQIQTNPDVTITTVNPDPTPTAGAGATATPTPVPTATPGLVSPLILTPTPTLAPTPTTRATATPTPVPSRQTSLTASELRDLRQYALELINADRSKHGATPVRLGTNGAAQDHADDMLEHGYYGHWWVDGRKPYMVYSELGGTSYVSENVGWRGYESDCDSPRVNCPILDPRENLEHLHNGMMYDDAASNWGHRDTIIESTHRVVNIGIGFNGLQLYFVQHFEGGKVRADGLPTLTSNGNLTLSLTKAEQGIRISSPSDGSGSVVGVYHEPLPTPKTPAQIAGLGRYCVGGGFTERCGDVAFRILEPLADGWEYTGLADNEIVASRWRETSDGFELRARLGSLTPGVYTINVWQNDGGDRLTEELLQLSVYLR